MAVEFARTVPAPMNISQTVPAWLRRRWLLAALASLVLVATLVMFVPHRATAPPPPARPPRDEAFVDRAHLVSPTFADAKSSLLIENAELAQVLVVIAPDAPLGDLEDYTIDTASAWQVGSEHVDNGLVLFIFRDAHKARVEVGYGLEGTLPDGLLRDLVDQTLVPAFARGAYEPGLDALVDGLLGTLRDDQLLRRADAGSDSRLALVMSAFARFPRLARITWRAFVDANLNGRLAVAMFALTAIWVVGCGVFFAFRIVLAIYQLMRGPSARDADTKSQFGFVFDRVFYLIMCTWGVAFCLALTVGVLLQAEEFLPRKGHFGGAGITVLWSPSG